MRPNATEACYTPHLKKHFTHFLKTCRNSHIHTYSFSFENVHGRSIYFPIGHQPIHNILLPQRSGKNILDIIRSLENFKIEIFIPFLRTLQKKIRFVFLESNFGQKPLKMNFFSQNYSIMNNIKIAISHCRLKAEQTKILLGRIDPIRVLTGHIKYHGKQTN